MQDDLENKSEREAAITTGALPSDDADASDVASIEGEVVGEESAGDEGEQSDQPVAEPEAVPAAKRRIRLPAIRDAASGLLRKLVPSEEDGEHLPAWVDWTKRRFFPDDVVSPDDDRAFMNTSRLVRRGNLVVGVFVIGTLVWGAVVPLDSAIVAHGEIVVQTHSKTIQHLEGGIVREIRAADGQAVKAGQVLVLLDDTQARANLSILRGQVDALAAQESRLMAERDGREEIEFPKDLLARASDPTVAEALLGEQKAFESRKKAMQQQVGVLGLRTGENWRMIAGLRSQQAAVAHQKELVDQEVTSVEGLYKQGLATLPRLLALQRQAADLSGQAGQLAEKIAQVQLSSGENNIQISRARQEQLSQVVQDLRDVQTKKFGAMDRLKAAEDTLKHTTLTSPVTGTVVNLSVHTVGAVVKPGETLMEIVPKDDRLDVQAQIRPEDADDLYPGMEARVNFSAYKQRSLPLIMGKVQTISADRILDQRSGQSYFNLTASVDSNQLKAYPDVRLMPGLPVEIEIATGSRTALQYLFSPISRAMRHGMRER